MRELRFILREGWRALRRTSLAGTLAILALTVLTTLAALAAGIQQSLDLAEQRMMSSFELEAFVEPGRERLLADIAMRMKEREGVSATDTIGKDLAAERFAGRHGEEILGLLEENPLPVSVIVHYDPLWMTSARMLAEADAIEADDDISEVAFDGDLMRRFEAISGQVWMIAGLIALGIAAVAAFLTYQSVRVAARTGRDWARAVLLVGGTAAQVRAPLALCGLFAGLIGGVLGAALVGTVQWLLSDSPWVLPPDPMRLAASVAVAMTVGVLGAWRAVPGRL